MKVLGEFNPTAHPRNLPSLNCALFILLLLTSSLKASIITIATKVTAETDTEIWVMMNCFHCRPIW